MWCSGRFWHLVYSDCWDVCAMGENSPENTRCWTNAGLMLGHRLRRWHNIKPALGQRHVFAEICFDRSEFRVDLRPWCGLSGGQSFVSHNRVGVLWLASQCVPTIPEKSDWFWYILLKAPACAVQTPDTGPAFSCTTVVHHSGRSP